LQLDARPFFEKYVDDGFNETQRFSCTICVPVAPL
jgi:hypothetical protein